MRKYLLPNVPSSTLEFYMISVEVDEKHPVTTSAITETTYVSHIALASFKKQTRKCMQHNRNCVLFRGVEAILWTQQVPEYEGQFRVLFDCDRLRFKWQRTPGIWILREMGDGCPKRGENFPYAVTSGYRSALSV